MMVAVALALAGAMAVIHVAAAATTAQLPFVNERGLLDCFMTSRTDAVRYPWSLPIARAFQDSARHAAYTGIGRFTVRVQIVDAAPQFLAVEAVTASYPDVAGVRPTVGRWFSGDEDVRQSRVAILSDPLCKQIAADTSACLGRQIKVRKDSFTIIGVTPPNYRGLFGAADLWIPAGDTMLAVGPQGTLNLTTAVATHWVSVIARIAPETDVKTARNELEDIARRFALANGLATASMSSSEWPLYEMVPIGESRTDPKLLRGARAMQWAVVVLVLAAVTNAALLLFVRAHASWRDVAIRSALGISGRRLAAQTVSRVAMTALVACGIGNLLAVSVHSAVLRIMSYESYEAATPWSDLSRSGLDLIVAGIPVTAATLASLFLLGCLVAAYEAHLGRDAAILSSHGAIGPMARSSRGRHALALLVALQVACASCACFWAGLLGKSYHAVVSGPIGFSQEAVIAIRPTVGSLEYGQPQVDSLRDRLLAIPGATRVSVVDCLPFSGACLSASIRRVDDPRRTTTGTLNRVGADAMTILGMHVTKGRPLSTSPDPLTAPDPAARPGGPVEVALSESAVTALFGASDAIGQLVDIDGVARDTLRGTIVGVVPDIKYAGSTEPPKGALYMRAARTLGPGWAMVVSTADPRTATTERLIRAAVGDHFPSGARPSVVTLTSLVAAATESQTRQATIVLIFAGFSLLSALSGAAALTRYTISRRVTELGLRLTLGATPRTLVLWLTTDFVAFVVSGAIAGASAGLLGGRVLSAILYQVSGADVTVLAAATTMVVLASVATIAITAHRAARIDPASVLRAT
jgi:putative ABC transport system permease protein